MKARQQLRASSSSLFLMELIMAILVFAVAGSACITVFVKSHMMSLEARELTEASLRLSSAAEEIRGNDLPVPSYQLWLDADFRECPESKAHYLLTVETALHGSLQDAELTFDRLENSARAPERIYALTVTHHIREVSP